MSDCKDGRKWCSLRKGGTRWGDFQNEGGWCDRAVISKKVPSPVTDPHQIECTSGDTAPGGEGNQVLEGIVEQHVMVQS